jgi:hypothetical protein
MDKATVSVIIKFITLNQRNINYLFRKENGLNKTHVEILALANALTCVNPYEVQKQFMQMNIQQVRLGIKKLSLMGALELMRPGIKNKPAVYMITTNGRELLDSYTQSWLDQLTA